MRKLIISSIVGAVVGVLIASVLLPFEGVIRVAAYPGCQVLDFAETLSQGTSYDEAKRTSLSNTKKINQVAEQIENNKDEISNKKQSIKWLKINYDRLSTSCGSFNRSDNGELLRRKILENSTEIKNIRSLVDEENKKPKFLQHDMDELANKLIKAVGESLSLNNCTKLEDTINDLNRDSSEFNKLNDKLIDLEEEYKNLVNNSKNLTTMSEKRMNAKLPKICIKLLNRDNGGKT